MYRIIADDRLIYNDSTPDLTSTKLIDPSLSLKDNAAGSFTATIPIGNVCYDDIVPFDTTINIYRRNQNGTETWLWRGRPVSISKDFWNQKQITCEGALAFLNDTVIPLDKLQRYSVIEYVGYLLDIHNGKVPNDRRIYRGVISSISSSGAAIGYKDYIVEGDNTITYITKIAEDWGLHIRIRESGGDLFLDMLTDSQLVMSTQSVDFGKNLLDYTDNYDWADVITAILPLGGKLESFDETGDEEFPDRLTIEGKHASTSGLRVDGKYLLNTDAINEHGRIEQTVEWSDIEDANELLALAELYLKDYQYNTMTLTVKVLDLHYLLGSGYSAFDFLTQINCYSKPHGLASTFLVSEMSIPFDNPENTTFSMTRQTMGKYGSDRTAGHGKGKISAATSNIPTREGVLKSARENAAAMIDMATNGWITLVPDENEPERVGALTITNNRDMDSSTQMWKWTLGGLMFQDRSSIGSDWNAPNVAITMDGQIVATMITTGILTVDDGQGGILFQADFTQGQRSVYIAGFNVTDTSIYNTKENLDDDQDSGVYIGNDGVAIGSENDGLFKVDVTNGTALISGFNFDNEKLWTGDHSDIEASEEGVYAGVNGFSTSDGRWMSMYSDGKISFGVDGSYGSAISAQANDSILIEAPGGIYFDGPITVQTGGGGYVEAIDAEVRITQRYQYTYSTINVTPRNMTIAFNIPKNMRITGKSYSDGYLTDVDTYIDYDTEPYEFNVTYDVQVNDGETVTEECEPLDWDTKDLYFYNGVLTQYDQ